MTVGPQGLAFDQDSPMYFAPARSAEVLKGLWWSRILCHHTAPNLLQQGESLPYEGSQYYANACRVRSGPEGLLSSEDAAPMMMLTMVRSCDCHVNNNVDDDLSVIVSCQEGTAFGVHGEPDPRPRLLGAGGLLRILFPALSGIKHKCKHG